MNLQVVCTSLWKGEVLLQHTRHTCYSSQPEANAQKHVKRREHLKSNSPKLMVCTSGYKLESVQSDTSKHEAQISDVDTPHVVSISTTRRLWQWSYVAGRLGLEARFLFRGEFPTTFSILNPINPCALDPSPPSTAVL